MKKSFLISITDSHESDGEKLVSEFSAPGEFAFGSDGFTISYVEADPSMEGSVTTVECTGNRVVMTRRGAYSTQLVLETGIRRTCYYDTPFGELVLGVYTRLIKADMTADGGILDLCYTLDFSGGPPSVNCLTIKVEKKEGINDVISSQ